MRTSALVRLAGGLAASALGLTLLGAAPATADDTPLPTVVGDTVRLYPGQVSEINVLANDTSASSDTLDVCRFPQLDLDAPAPKVFAMELGILGNKAGDIVVGAAPRARGTHVINYFVCDTHHLVPAKLTVEMRTVVPVQVRKVAGKPGRLLVTNKNTAPVRISYGDPRGVRADGKARIAAGSSRVVTVRRHKIVWVAEIGPKGNETSLASPGIAGQGVVRGIKLRPGQELPPPKKPKPTDF